jgi:transcription initiation factor TFIID subunit TAF12
MPLGRRGRPGLVGTMARTAVVAGTATAVSNNVSRRQYARQEQKADAAAQQEWEQQQQWAQQQAAAAPPPPPAAAGGMNDDVIEQLTKLASLKDQGILTEEEFAAQKAKLLA